MTGADREYIFDMNASIDELQTICLHIDHKRMSNVIHTLMSNAVKYTKRRGQVNVNVEFVPLHPVYENERTRRGCSRHFTPVTVSPGNNTGPDLLPVGYIRITVADNGCGIHEVT